MPSSRAERWPPPPLLSSWVTRLCLDPYGPPSLWPGPSYQHKRTGQNCLMWREVMDRRHMISAAHGTGVLIKCVPVTFYWWPTYTSSHVKYLKGNINVSVGPCDVNYRRTGTRIRSRYWALSMALCVCGTRHRIIQSMVSMCEWLWTTNIEFVAFYFLPQAWPIETTKPDESILYWKVLYCLNVLCANGQCYVFQGGRFFNACAILQSPIVHYFWPEPYVGNSVPVWGRPYIPRQKRNWFH